MFNFQGLTDEQMEDLGIENGQTKQKYTLTFDNEQDGANAKSELETNGAAYYVGAGTTFVPDPETSDIVIMYVPTPGMAVIIIVVLR